MVGYNTVYDILKNNNQYTKVQFYSSTLPRAMQTAKLISYGLEKAIQDKGELDNIKLNKLKKLNGEIKVLVGVQETLKWAGSSGEIHDSGANVMTKDEVKNYAKVLNFIERDRGIEINGHFVMGDNDFEKYVRTDLNKLWQHLNISKLNKYV